jgi:hypothetical protein
MRESREMAVAFGRGRGFAPGRLIRVGPGRWSCIWDHRVDQLRRHGAYRNVQTVIASAIALWLLERCSHADGRAAFKERSRPPSPRGRRGAGPAPAHMSG